MVANVPATPPPGSKIVGQHTDGRPIYEREIRVKVGSRPKMRNGQEVWVRHPTTQEPIRQIFESVYRVERRRFVMETMSNGSAFPNYDFEASPEEKARLERLRKARELEQSFFERAAARGLSADELLDALTGVREQTAELRAGEPEQERKLEPEPEAGGDPPAVGEFPVPAGSGRWLLSDGTKIKGRKADALLAQAELDRKAAAEFAGAGATG